MSKAIDKISKTTKIYRLKDRMKDVEYYLPDLGVASSVTIANSPKN